MWKLSIQDDQGSTTVVSLVRDTYDLGRSEDNTVRLTERNVSRRHARLDRAEHGWVLSDLSSYNGCFVNGERVLNTRPLGHGDLAQLGDYRLTVIDDSMPLAAGGDTGVTVPATPGSVPLLDQPDRLVMLVGPTPGVEFPLTLRRVVVGRGDECDVTLNHNSVSRVHAELLTLEDGRYEIVDLNSANSVRVNGVELQRTILDARDNIELGDVVLKFIPAGQIYRPSPEESQQISAVTSATGRGSMSRWFYGIAAFVGAGLALAVVVSLVLEREGPPSSPPGGTAMAAEDAASLLEQAQALLEGGQIDQAHLKVGLIPETSNARQSAGFRRVESEWADAVFRRAEETDDPSLRRHLYESVAKAASIDTSRRQKAAQAVAELDDSEGVDVTELPKRMAPPEPSRDGGASRARRSPQYDVVAPESVVLEATVPKGPTRQRGPANPAPPFQPKGP